MATAPPTSVPYEWLLEEAKNADVMVHESGEDPAQGLDTPS